jgi:hypothetical protein
VTRFHERAGGQVEALFYFQEETMTVSDLAGFFGKGESTIRRHAQDAGIPMQNGIRKIFTRAEVEHLASYVYGKVPQPVADAIALAFRTSPNDKARPLPNSEVRRLPNGAQLREIRILWEKKAIDRQQVAQALGLALFENKALALLPEPTPHERDIVLKGLLEITDGLKAKVIRAGAGATSRVLTKAQSDQAVERENYHLGFGDQRA